MKFTNPLKTAVISISIIAALLALALPSYLDKKRCAKAEQANSCQQILDHNWLSWIKGNSRSPQFHFVDLLELLNRF